MKTHVPTSLEVASRSPAFVDAVYFVVRVLRNALRGYEKPIVSTEPSRSARKLAAKAIAEIETAEGRQVAQIDQARLSEYVSALTKFLIDRTAPDPSVLKDAEKTLNDMRLTRI